MMTRHDDHYKDMPIQPIEAMEQVARNAQDHERGLLAAMACKYILRAGTKDEWTKDIEKASNYLYRALHGVWPWDVSGDLDKWEKLRTSEIIPPLDSGYKLIGRMCWVWDDHTRFAKDGIIEEYVKKGMKGSWHDAEQSPVENDWYRVCDNIYMHAQPVELGHPDINSPEYRGER